MTVVVLLAVLRVGASRRPPVRLRSGKRHRAPLGDWVPEPIFESRQGGGISLSSIQLRGFGSGAEARGAKLLLLLRKSG